MTPAEIVEKLQGKYEGAMVSSRTYKNEARKNVLEFSVKYPDPKPVGQIRQQGKQAAIIFNKKVLPQDLGVRVLRFFEREL